MQESELQTNLYNQYTNLHSVLYSFVSLNSLHFDKAHNIDHVLRVVSNAVKIYEETDEEERLGVDLDLIIVCCYLHDIRDHKMLDSDQTITELELRKFILSIGYDPDLVLPIINTISYSKERKLEVNNERGSGYERIISLFEQVNTHFDRMTVQKLMYIRNVVSDADKLDALGEQGIARCISYGEHIGVGGDIGRIVEHCEYKLLHLKGMYIHTEVGKSLAVDLHNYTLQWYKEERKHLSHDYTSCGLVRD